MSYAVRITSRYTGKSLVLGTKWETEEEAIKDAEVNVCQRCNRYAIVRVPDKDVWQNKNVGFVPRHD